MSESRKDDTLIESNSRSESHKNNVSVAQQQKDVIEKLMEKIN